MSKEKILIVDDEEHIVELLKFNLQSAGYEVMEANNGIDALKIANENKPSLMLLDLMLPGMDGFDVCKEIKRNNEMKNTSIIMLTAKGEDDLIKSGVDEKNIFTLGICTYCNEDIKLYSYRKSEGAYGRMFSFVFLK